MHHRPARPTPSARTTGGARRGVGRAQRSPRRHGGRLAAGMALTTVVTGLLLAVPVVSTGSGTSPVALDSSSSSATRLPEKSSPVVMGRDGVPAPSSATVDVPAAPSVPEAPGRTSSSAVEVPVASGTPQPSTADGPGPAAPSSAASSAAEHPAGGQSVGPPSAAASPAGTASTGTSSPGTSSSARSSSGAPSAAPLPADTEAEVLASVNAARADAGCDPLVHDSGLAAVARAHSANMRDQDFFGRRTPEGLGLLDRAAAAGHDHARAANIAQGQPTPAAVTNGWLHDDKDRENILDCALRTVGVGGARGPGGPWWTLLFGD